MVRSRTNSGEKKTPSVVTVGLGCCAAEKKGIPTLKCWHFKASEDVITKLKSQGLYITLIKYWNASGSGFPTSLIPTFWNIDILYHKQATRIKHFCPKCILWGFVPIDSRFIQGNLLHLKHVQNAFISTDY